MACRRKGGEPVHLTRKQLARSRLTLTAILLLLCIVLLVGTVWARYLEEKTDYLKYKTREPGVISIWPGYNAATGRLTEGDCVWSFMDGIGTLRFYLSNSTPEVNYSDEDLRVSIRLLGSLSARNAQVVMSISDGTSTMRLTASPVEIVNGTPLFDTFGSGNAYVFLDESGAEFEWDLEGGALSVLSVQIDVWNLDGIEDPALLQLQVLER